MSVYQGDELGDLKEALESLYAQTRKADIFIQLDGSVSNSIESFLEQELMFKKIIYLGKREQNKGLAYSLNELLSRVIDAYDYVARMDADDICLPDRIQKQVDFLEMHHEIDIIGSWIQEFNIDTGEEQVIQYPQTHGSILKEMGKRCAMAHVSTVFRKTFFEKAGVYDPQRLTEDYDLWVRGLEHGCRFANLPCVLVKVRTSNAFYNRRKNVKRAYDVMSIKMKAIDRFALSKVGYLYAIAHFFLYLSPAFVKHFIYKKFR